MPSSMQQEATSGDGLCHLDMCRWLCDVHTGQSHLTAHFSEPVPTIKQLTAIPFPAFLLIWFLQLNRQTSQPRNTDLATVSVWACCVFVIIQFIFFLIFILILSFEEVYWLISKSLGIFYLLFYYWLLVLIFWGRTGSYYVTMQPRLALNSQSSCFSLSSVGITGMYHHAELILV
jgi:hypothetical protein